MAKRTVIRIGDIFCAEIDGKFKCYFQYICKDTTMMSSQVIRVFKAHYALSDIPTIEEIIHDEVSFYAHVPISAGVKLNAWYKVDKCNTIPDAKELDKILFAYCSGSFYDECGPINYQNQNPIDNWLVWHINKPMKHYHLRQLTEKQKDTILDGAIEAFCDVVNRMKYGYYWYTDVMYDVIRRSPLPDVDSYCRRDGIGVAVFYHFHGENLIREVFVDNGMHYRLSVQEPMSDKYSLDSIKFWDVNWKRNELITEEEFDQAWQQ